MTDDLIRRAFVAMGGAHGDVKQTQEDEFVGEALRWLRGRGLETIVIYGHYIGCRYPGPVMWQEYHGPLESCLASAVLHAAGEA